MARLKSPNALIFLAMSSKFLDTLVALHVSKEPSLLKLKRLWPLKHPPVTWLPVRLGITHELERMSHGKACAPKDYEGFSQSTTDSR